MLSNISSFISEKLDRLDLHLDREQQQQQQPRHNGQQTLEEEDGGGGQPAQQQRRDTAADGPKKEKRKKVSSNEAFIIVRPPPAKNNHPLNLQIQLVPAQHSRDRSNTSATPTPSNSRISADFSSQGDAAAAAAAAAAVAGAASQQPAQQPPPSPSTSASETDHHLQQQQGAAADGAPRRSPSLRSNRSDTSTAFYASASSAGSVSSFASTSSTASGRRMIIPLYNLSAHNVMTNTVLDAGTDAKIAKFQKRGIEVLGLVVLEPVEVWSGDLDAAAARLIQRKASALSLAPPPPSHHGHHNGHAQDQHSQHSPSSSRLSLSSAHSSIPSDPPTTAAVPVPSSSPQQLTGARKLFGRVFRRKEGSGGGGGGGGGHTPTLSDSSPTPTQTPALTPAPTLASPPIATIEPPPPVPHTTTTTITSREERRQQQRQQQQQPDVVLLPPVLGLTPTAANAIPPPPGGRCVAHVWVVRRWLKTEAQGLFSGVVAKIHREVSSSSPTAAEDGSLLSPGAGAAAWEVRFEWARGKSKRAIASTAAAAAAAAAAATATPRVDDGSMGRRSSRTSSRRSSALVNVDEEQQQQPGGLPHVRLSIDAGEGGVDVGDESDPEDSETPWTCTLVLSHPSSRAAAKAGSHSRRGSMVVQQQGNGHHSRRESSSVGVSAWTEFGAGGLDEGGAQQQSLAHLQHPSPPQQETRIKIATLSPAPHHPKVVGQLRVPFPLPDVEVESGTVHRRVVTPDGGTRSTVPPSPPPSLSSRAQQTQGRGGARAGMILTAEEIKDVVCCTAFWVVVRQSFGGIGKKTRKGDGWRIRA